MRAKLFVATGMLAGMIGSALPGARLHAAEVKESYDDGKPKLQYQTDARKQKNGPYEEFYPTGKVKVRGQYLLGRKSGTWIQFDPSGKILETASWRSDQLDGPYSWNFPSGKPALRATYRLGQLYGAVTVLDEKGETVRRINYPLARETVDKSFLSLYPFEKPAEKFAVVAVAKKPYQAGVLSPAMLDAALNLTKLYRELSSLPWEQMAVDPGLSDLSAHGAVILSKQGEKTHKPQKPTDMDAGFFKLGLAGCMQGNIFQGSASPIDAVKSFMDDSSDDDVEAMEQRQWMLSPNLQNIGFGAAGRHVVMNVASGGRPGHGDFNYIAFPGEGYYPRQLIEPHSAWSLHLNAAKAKAGPMESIKISMHKLDEHFQITGDAIDVKVISTPESANPAFGWSTIVFKPDLGDFDLARYWVDIRGITTTGGVPVPFGYMVEFIDGPDKHPTVAADSTPVELTPAQKTVADLKLAKSMLGKKVTDLQFDGFAANALSMDGDGNTTYRIKQPGEDTQITVNTDSTDKIVSAVVNGQTASGAPETQPAPAPASSETPKAMTKPKGK